MVRLRDRPRSPARRGAPQPGHPEYHSPARAASGPPADRSRASTGRSGASRPCSELPSIGRERRPQRARAPAAGQPLRPAVRVRQDHASGAPEGLRVSKSVRCAPVRNGRSAASSASQGALTSARPRRRPATGPPPGGSSHTQTSQPGRPAASAASALVHGARPRRPHDDQPAGAGSRSAACATETRSGVPPTARPGLSAPPIRAALPPARTTVSKSGSLAGAGHRRLPGLSRRWPTSAWRAGGTQDR